jgi:hypothetical protein
VPVMKCCQGYKKLFGIFPIRNKHIFIISNVFYTLEDQNQVDVVKRCIKCTAREAFGTDQQTLMELVDKFPRAFDQLLLEYLKTWKI